MMRPVLYGLAPGFSSMMEKHPQMALSMHAWREGRSEQALNRHRSVIYLECDIQS